jgi:hypothetical protein
MTYHDFQDDLQKQVMGLLLPFCDAAKIDWKGHFQSGAYFSGRYRESIVKDSVEHSIVFGGELAVTQIAAIPSGEVLEKPIAFPFFRLECSFCGQRLHMGFNGQGLVLLDDACPYATGLVTEWELNVPSGKIVVANDLRKWFPVDEDHDVNRVIGCHLTTLAYAKIGMAHGFVSNTSPGVYQTDSGFVIGSYDEDWDGDEEEDDDDIGEDETGDYGESAPCPWGESVASICTDLWWYSICDGDELERRRQRYTPKDLVDCDVVDVRPGVYRFRQEQGIDHDASVVEHATFEWVREPDPVRDYLKEEREKHLSATEVLIQACLSWPTLYMGMRKEGGLEHVLKAWKGFTAEEKAGSLASAANHFMCVLGGGVEWHENGFPRTAVSDEAKKLAAEYGDVPSFDFKAHWYPISAGYGGLCLGAGLRAKHMQDTPLIDLAPDFVKLGLNICQNAIKFGEEPGLNTNVYPPAYEIPSCRERMGLFVKCYWALRKRYPEVVLDVEFDAWMADEETVQKYVAEFNFGPERPPKKTWGKPPSTIKTGTYFEFDASILDDGGFCWAKGCWARKEDAERYAIGIVSMEDGKLCVDASARQPCMIPLKAVGRVLRGTGEGHFSKHLVVAFDYGSENMRGEMAFDARDMPAVRQFSDEQEYRALLERYKDDLEDVDREERASLSRRIDSTHGGSSEPGRNPR